jgi:ABC-type sulfate/molybdate transport systems ATPase subunit
MVLSNGRIEEFDNPQQLLANPNSLFTKLAKDAGLVAGGVSNGNNGSKKGEEASPEDKTKHT